MTDDERLIALRDLIQEDVGRRGLRAVPGDNLITACEGDFAAACRGLASAEAPRVAVVTGFTIAGARPPCAETDGPLGALFLARALVPLGIPVALATDGTALPALQAGVAACGLTGQVPVVELPDAPDAYAGSIVEHQKKLHHDYLFEFLGRVGSVSHLIALERVGPNHTRESIVLSGQPPTEGDLRRDLPPSRRGRCHSMRGLDVTEWTRPAHLLFERPPWVTVGGLTTIGIGDGGNEIGMGKVPWSTVRENIPNGGLIACRVKTDHLIVAGVSNWGAYALAAGVRLLRRTAFDPGLYDVGRERELLEVMVKAGPLVDGVLAQPSTSVDGLTFSGYADVLRQIGEIEQG
jgi:hypothetical protein